MDKFNGIVQTVLSVAVLIAVITSNIAIHKRMDITSCRLDVANARIDRLEGREPAVPECAKAFMGTTDPLRSHDPERRT